MQTIILAIVPVFLLIAFGVIVKLIQNSQRTWLQSLFSKIKHTEDKWSEVLNKYVLYIALPALVIHSLANTGSNGLLPPNLVALNLIVLAAVMILIWAYTSIFHVDKKLANAYILCAVFGNVAYIGFPFITSLIKNSAGQVSVLVGIHVAIAFTIGVFILEHSKNRHISWKSLIAKIVLNPLLLSVIIGFLLLKFNVSIPVTINQALQMLAASASPVILVAIGLFIARRIEWDMTLVHAFVISGIKLFVLPLIFVILSISMELKSIMHISILEAAMPVALTNFALAEIYPMDKKLVAKAIIVSTVVSIFTLTAWSNFLI